MKIERLIFKNKADGFSLVEVNLAVMLVALGLLVLFSLFPAGLNQGERAHSDTQSALFANYVMSTIRARTAEFSWTYFGGGATGTSFLDPGPTFMQANNFRDAVLNPVGYSVYDTGTNEVANAIEFPSGSGNWLKYMLAIDPVKNPDPTIENKRLWAVNLWVWGGRYGPTDPGLFMNRSKWFYTELFYSGMP